METIVSVRMPKALFEKLQSLSHDQHYMDISECLRSITRKKCLELSSPYSFELSQLRQELSKALTQKEEVQKKNQLVEDLHKILKELEGKGGERK